MFIPVGTRHGAEWLADAMAPNFGSRAEKSDGGVTNASAALLSIFISCSHRRSTTMQKYEQSEEIKKLIFRDNYCVCLW